MSVIHTFMNETQFSSPLVYLPIDGHDYDHVSLNDRENGHGCVSANHHECLHGRVSDRVCRHDLLDPLSLLLLHHQC